MNKRKKIIMCILVVAVLAVATIPFVFADTPKTIRKDVIKVNQTTTFVEEETNKEYKNYYFLGDSRSVGMNSIDENKNHFYTAKIGEGYQYFSNNYKSVIEKSTGNDAIIINFGVNDLHNAEKYIELINKISSQTKSDVYFLTVNPVDEEKEINSGYKIKNSDIDNFNKKLKNGLSSSVKIIDSNSLLKRNGFNTIDGIHYTNDTYKNILHIATNAN